MQYIRHRCEDGEYRQLRDGAQSHIIRIEDPASPIEKGDIITVEVMNGTAETFFRRVGSVTTHKDFPQRIRQRAENIGIVIVGLVPVEHGTLKGLFSSTYLMSFELLRNPPLDPSEAEAEAEAEAEPEGIPDEYKDWIFGEGPYYAPATACPHFADYGLIDSLNVHRWPEGSYSLTLLLSVSDANEAGTQEFDIKESLVLVAVEHPDKDADVPWMQEIDLQNLMMGTVVNANTKEPVTPMCANDVSALRAEPATKEELADYSELLSEEEMMHLIKRSELPNTQEGYE